jgi:hypothetical protein
MAKTRTKGLGSVVNFTPTGGSKAEITCIMTINPPGNEYEELDGTCLGDDFEVIGRGIEKSTEFSIKELWHIGGHASDALNTVAASSHAGTGTFEIVAAGGTTMTFTAILTKLSPESIEKNKYLSRMATFKRTGDITYA